MSVRRMALEALMDITEHGAYANLRLKRAQDRLPEKDAKWLAAIVYETLDRLAYIDYMLACFTRGRVKPVIRNILRLSACEMLFMRVPAHAACNEGVKLTTQVGKAALSGYVNGVLRTLARRLDDLPALPEDVVERFFVLYGYPRFLIHEWIDRFGEDDAQALMRTGPFPMQVRAQPPFTTQALVQALQDEGIGCTPGKYDPHCLWLSRGFDIANNPLFLSGCMTVQSESAMLACRACGVQKGMRVLDACAAPGGKSAYLYALAGGEIELHAWEVHPHRLELLNKTLARLHVQAKSGLRDALVPAPEYDDYFDLVFVDAPCSSLGLNKPDARLNKTEADIRALAALQDKLLLTCAQYVKPGGTLVYATCTISREENERRVEAFLHAREDFRLTAFPDDVRIPGAREGMAQLLPHRDQLEGFFIARMRRMM